MFIPQNSIIKYYVSVQTNEFLNKQDVTIDMIIKVIIALSTAGSGVFGKAKDFLIKHLSKYGFINFKSLPVVLERISKTAGYDLSIHNGEPKYGIIVSKQFESMPTNTYLTNFKSSIDRWSDFPNIEGVLGRKSKYLQNNGFDILPEGTIDNTQNLDFYMY